MEPYLPLLLKADRRPIRWYELEQNSTLHHQQLKLKLSNNNNNNNNTNVQSLIIGGWWYPVEKKNTSIMKRIPLISATLLFCLFFPVAIQGSSSGSTISTPPPALPRSQRHRRRSNPPWNPSTLIDDDGFLRHIYRRIPGEWEREVRLKTLSLDPPVCIRQVPGDGNCLFHSISLCLQHAINSTHWDLSNSIEELYEHSQALRERAVACLRQHSRRLYLQGRETLIAHELVQAAAQQYGLTAPEYCAAMQQDCVWGGGPEIVALSNILQRPIHVYELAVQDNRFFLRRMACFGSPKFDRYEALHILSADSRFPDVAPGQQLAAGNHFLAVFPIPQKRLRGGSESRILEEDIKSATRKASRWNRWWKRWSVVFS